MKRRESFGVAGSGHLFGVAVPPGGEGEVEASGEVAVVESSAMGIGEGLVGFLHLDEPLRVLRRAIGGGADVWVVPPGELLVSPLYLGGAAVLGDAKQIVEAPPPFADLSRRRYSVVYGSACPEGGGGGGSG